MPTRKVLRRRAGMATPLFSIQSKKSVGVGEFADLEVLSDWCLSAGLSVIQLLPLNDVGFNFRPYDTESSWALEPMHLSLERITSVPLDGFTEEILSLRKKYPLNSPWFDTRVKKDKMVLLKRMFQSRSPRGDKAFRRYCDAQRFWLEDYALFKVIKEKMNGSAWEAWPEAFRSRDAKTLRGLQADEKRKLEFHRWLQWQIFLQFTDTARAVSKKGVKLMGDLPFLVSRDSADVWSRPDYFKLPLSAGAPPDLYFSDGQEWGMPPYDWEALARGNYDYLIEKLKYAEHFYDMFRIDHFVGLFRVWAFPREGPEPERKKKGAFDPPEETRWEEQGERILSVILSNTTMLPCAEDLGTVPDYSFQVLARHGIPGMEIQRWARDWNGTKDFKAPEEYRPNSVVSLSTHDMAPFWPWWNEEALPDEKERFWKAAKLPGVMQPRCSKKLVLAALTMAARARSVFSIHLWQDYLALQRIPEKDGADLRINRPGIVHEKNWRLRLPFYLEELKALPIHKTLRELNRRTERA